LPICPPGPRQLEIRKQTLLPCTQEAEVEFEVKANISYVASPCPKKGRKERKGREGKGRKKEKKLLVAFYFIFLMGLRFDLSVLQSRCSVT
jgi:hypothetical protein